MMLSRTSICIADVHQEGPYRGTGLGCETYSYTAPSPFYTPLEPEKAPTAQTVLPK
jgi:hypothetical protein